MGKKPPKSKIKGKVDADLAAKRLDRNVPRGKSAKAQSHMEGIKEVSLESLKLLRDPARTDEAVELLQRYANEADPSKPGYRGDEVPAAVVRALSQLPNARRDELLKLAGNPQIFAGIPSGFDPLEMPADLQQQTMEAAVLEAFGAPPAPLAKRSHTARPVTAEEAVDLSRNPTTLAGHEYAKAQKDTRRAPIDRNVPRIPVDPETGRQVITDEMLTTLSPDQEKARQDIISRIVGEGQAQQVFASLANGKIPVLPAVPGRPAARSAGPIPPNTFLEGASDSDMERAFSRLEKFNDIPTSPDADLFSGLFDEPLPESARTAGDARRSLVEPIRTAKTRYGLQNPLGPEDIGAGGTQRIPPMRDPNLLPTAQNIRSGLPPVLSPEMKEGGKERILAELTEMARRRKAADGIEGTGLDIGSLIDPIYVGTQGLQGPYGGRQGRGGLTNDQQLNRSTRSEADRVVEALYMAARARGLPGQQARTVDLDRLYPGWRNQQAIPDGEGGWTVPDGAPTPEFLATRMAGDFGIEDPDTFARDVAPVLEEAIREQYGLSPATQQAADARKVLMVPGSSPRSEGYRFFNSPHSSGFLAGMFDESMPMNRPEPEVFTQPLGESPILPTDGPDPLDRPSVTGGSDALSRPDPMEYVDPLDRPRPTGLRALLDDDQPIVAPEDTDLSYRTMNKLRSGPLMGLYA